MGLIMEFYAGDARQIAAGVTEGAPLQSAPFVLAHADFSLHLGPTDLDPLVAAVCQRSGLPPTPLKFVEHLAGPADPTVAEFGVEVVDPKVVQAFGLLTADDVQPISQQWADAIEIDLSADAAYAVRELVELCQLAQAENAAVVFSWSL